jgi:hypothetical protein
MADFLEVYPEAIPANLCTAITELFNESGQAVRGQVGSGVDTKLKNSYDITITGRPEWEEVEKLLQAAAFTGLAQYVRKYPYCMIGALALRFPDPATGENKLINLENFSSITEHQYLSTLSHIFRFGTINLQKYLGDKGGYPHWHSEIYPGDEASENLHRILLWTIYLNEVPEGGETEFYYQERKIKPQPGTLIIAPAGFTHTHRGNMPKGGDKYIATSWFLFQRSEVLYAPRS